MAASDCFRRMNAGSPCAWTPGPPAGGPAPLALVVGRFPPESHASPRRRRRPDHLPHSGGGAWGPPMGRGGGCQQSCPFRHSAHPGRAQGAGASEAGCGPAQPVPACGPRREGAWPRCVDDGQVGEHGLGGPVQVRMEVGRWGAGGQMAGDPPGSRGSMASDDGLDPRPERAPEGLSGAPSRGWALDGRRRPAGRRRRRCAHRGAGGGIQEFGLRESPALPGLGAGPEWPGPLPGRVLDP
jgi:hypothetical protein